MTVGVSYIFLHSVCCNITCSVISGKSSVEDDECPSLWETDGFPGCGTFIAKTKIIDHLVVRLWKKETEKGK